MTKLLPTTVVGLALALLSSLAWAEATDRGEMDQWMKVTEHQTEPPAGTTITMANWRQCQNVMPLGIIKLFQEVYDWKMPADVQMPRLQRSRVTPKDSSDGQLKWRAVKGEILGTERLYQPRDVAQKARLP